MATWIDVYDQYLNDVSGCTYKAAAEALRGAAQVFCEKTRAWRAALDPVMTRANQVGYEFDLSSEQEIVRVLSAKLAGEPLPVVLEGEADNYGRALVVHDPFRFSVKPAPAAGLRIEIQAALAPSNTASTLGDELARKHIKTIVLGAKAELLAKVNQPYSDPVRAIEFRQQFNAEIDRAIGQLATSFSSAPNRVRARFM